MLLSQEAVDLIKRFEGFRSRPYLCSANVPTIGYGSTFYKDGTRVTLQDRAMDETTANELLHHTLDTVFIHGVLRACPVLIAHENKLGAVTSFCYNLGVGRLQASTLRRKINAQEWDEAADQLLLWVRAGGKVLRGLQLRREAERELFLK